ncbi:hypothetical protein K1719_045439 [Acacia pycnantha]|nr:hypothetical protein K1719_045439 [Acacia pycnantha]
MKNQDAAFAGRFQSISPEPCSINAKMFAYSACNESWKKKRKVCVLQLLSLKRVRSFQAIRDEEVAEMVDEIRKACLSDNNCSVNISDLISTTTNNVILRIQMYNWTEVLYSRE